MKDLSHFPQIYLYRYPVDFRKQINGLCVLVQEEISLPFKETSLFVFTNKQRNRIKVLYWDRTGFALWLKRLEKSRFRWPKKLNQDVLSLSSQQLKWLLEGYDIMKLKSHQAVQYQELY